MWTAATSSKAFSKGLDRKGSVKVYDARRSTATKVTNSQSLSLAFDASFCCQISRTYIGAFSCVSYGKGTVIDSDSVSVTGCTKGIQSIRPWCGATRSGTKRRAVALCWACYGPKQQSAAVACSAMELRRNVVAYLALQCCVRQAQVNSTVLS